MAGNILLWLDGIPGESRDGLEGSHDGDVEVTTWGWGLANGAALDLKNKDVTAKPTPIDVTITKAVDTASATLMQRCASGETIFGATLTCRKNAGESKIEYLVIDFQKAKVTSVKWDAGEDGHITETVKLKFEIFETTYQGQDDETGAGRGYNHFGFNMPEHFKF